MCAAKAQLIAAIVHIEGTDNQSLNIGAQVYTSRPFLFHRDIKAAKVLDWTKHTYVGVSIKIAIQMSGCDRNKLNEIRIMYIIITISC